MDGTWEEKDMHSRDQAHLDIKYKAPILLFFPQVTQVSIVLKSSGPEETT